jgi:hypothetical protein
MLSEDVCHSLTASRQVLSVGYMGAYAPSLTGTAGACWILAGAIFGHKPTAKSGPAARGSRAAGSSRRPSCGSLRSPSEKVCEYASDITRPRSAVRTGASISGTRPMAGKVANMTFPLFSSLHRVAPSGSFTARVASLLRPDGVRHQQPPLVGYNSSFEEEATL